MILILFSTLNVKVNKIFQPEFKPFKVKQVSNLTSRTFEAKDRNSNRTAKNERRLNQHQSDVLIIRNATNFTSAIVEIFYKKGHRYENEGRIIPQRTETSRQSTFPQFVDRGVVNLKIYTGESGRLGNRLWELASAYGIARKTGRRVVFVNDSYNRLIVKQLNINVPVDRYPKHTTTIVERSYGVFSEKFYTLPPKDVIVGWYLQSWKYFSFYNAEIRRMYTFRNSVNTTYIARTFIESIIANKTISTALVAVHVRLTDAYKNITKPSYLRKAMDYFYKKFNRVKFVVISDNVTQCQNEMRFSNLIFSPFKSPFIDLAIMAAVNGTILTRASTFGWWGAFLCGHDVIYNRSSPPNILPQHFKWEDYYRPEWIPMYE